MINNGNGGHALYLHGDATVWISSGKVSNNATDSSSYAVHAYPGKVILSGSGIIENASKTAVYIGGSDTSDALFRMEGGTLKENAQW